jgi:hypothetical protein
MTRIRSDPNKSTASSGEAKSADIRIDVHTVIEGLVVPETPVGVIIRFRKGARRDSRSRSPYLQSARLGAHIGGKAIEGERSLIFCRDQRKPDQVLIRGVVPNFLEPLAVSRCRLALLFDFGKQGVEILAFGTFALVQACLHQAPEAKSMMQTHHAGTVRTLVWLVRSRGKGIS